MSAKPDVFINIDALSVMGMKITPEGGLLKSLLSWREKVKSVKHTDTKPLIGWVFYSGDKLVGGARIEFDVYGGDRELRRAVLFIKDGFVDSIRADLERKCLDCCLLQRDQWLPYGGEASDPGIERITNEVKQFFTRFD